MPLLTAVHLLNCNNYVFKSCEKWKSQCKIKIKITHLNFYLNKNDRKDMRKIDCIATDVWKMNTYNSIVMTYRVRDQIWSQKFAKTQRKIRWTWIMTKTLFTKSISIYSHVNDWLRWKPPFITLIDTYLSFWLFKRFFPREKNYFCSIGCFHTDLTRF